MSNYIPTFKPTTKRRSFRPNTFRPLDRTDAPPSLATLSDQLRASLMNVGMRVRKSVPEGYKTQDIKPGFTIYEQTAAAHPELLETSSSNKLLPPVELGYNSAITSVDLTIMDARNDENAMSDEQVAATVDDVLSGLDADLAGFTDGGKLDLDDAFSGPSSSQESNTSTASNGSSVRGVPTVFGARRPTKRVVREDDEDEIDRLWGGVAMERDAPLRQIAQPRSRRPQMRRNASSMSSGSGKSGGGAGKKKVAFAAFVPEDDFGDADFLMPDQP